MPGGLLQASLAVACGMVLVGLMDDPHVDRETIQEFAFTAFDAGLPSLWKRRADQELADKQTLVGMLWAERLRGDRWQNMEAAIACFGRALEIYSQDGTPHDWARAQNNLGAAYRARLGGARAQNVEEAIAYFGRALEVSLQRRREAVAR